MSRRRHVEAVGDVDLPITPMLDMAFQLLTFFIFTFHPSAVEGQMALTLPTEQVTANSQPIDPSAKPNKEELPEPTIELVILVKPQALGGEAPIIVEAKSVRTQIADKDALRVHLKEIFDRENAGIEAELKTVPAAKREDRRKELVAKLGIKVQPTSAVKWGQVVEIMDLCRAVGFTSVSFARPPDYNL